MQALGVGQFRTTTESSSDLAAFWRTAELLEMVEDAYQHSGRPLYKKMIVQLRRGVMLRYGTEWTDGRKFNDDVVWMVLAFLRAYDITGDARSRDAARQNFDAVVARGWSSDLGGGLWWTTDGHEKNACVNGPAAIAAYDLYQAVHIAAYLDRAKELYAWLRDHLFNPDTGAVFDHVSETADGAGVLNRVTYTYNQGTFIGAAQLLYLATGVPTYFIDALQAFAYARSHLTVNGVLREEGVGRDGGGFKGIFARYAVGFGQINDVAGADEWFMQNAAAAWSHRDARGLMGQDWSQPTSQGMLHAFDCSSAVVLLQQLRPARAAASMP